MSNAMDTVGDLARRLDEMTEERDFYKRELGLMRDEQRVAKLCAAFRLTRKEALLVDSLMAKKGALATKDHLMDAMYGGLPDDQPEIKIVDVFVCKARRKMGADAINTVWGQGYVLTGVGMEKCEAAMAVEGLPSPITGRHGRVENRVAA